MFPTTSGWYSSGCFRVAAERIEGPRIVLFVVAQDVEIAVIGADAEASVSDPVPLIEHFRHLIGAPIPRLRDEAQRALVRLVAGVAFDLETEAHCQEFDVTAYWLRGEG